MKTAIVIIIATLAAGWVASQVMMDGFTVISAALANIS